MTYAESIRFLYSLRLFGTKFGLENTYRLAELFGNPHLSLRFIHVAGTNGKGSTCAMLESIYRSSGLKTGLFTSPHLVSFTERIQVNRRSISEPDAARLTEKITERLGGSDKESWEFRPTFFEFITVMALIYFQERRCDLVIWETGLGGRLDATNIVTPLASVITNIQLDHEQWLGSSIRQIAGEKAGIIKPGVPVLTAARDRDALEVIAEQAARAGSRLIIVDRAETEPLSLLGAHQRQNAALARAVVEQLQGTLSVRNEVISAALAHTYWPGRLQLATLPAGRVLLDGAHNPDGALALAAALRGEFEGEEITMVLGLFKDKEWRRMCEILVPLCRRVLLVPVQSERSADPAMVQEFCQAHWPSVAMEPCPDLGSALDRALGAGLALVAGSLHLVGEAMERLGLTPGVRSERELNEWDAARANRR